MSAEEEHHGGDGETTTIRAEDLQGATTMIGEDGTQYIIVMEDTVAGEGDAALAVPDDASAAILAEGGASEAAAVKDETVYVVDDGHGNYQLVDPATAAAAVGAADGEGTTIVIDPSSLAAAGGDDANMQYLVDHEGNLYVDEEGNPYRMAVQDDSSGGSAVVSAGVADLKHGGAEYVIIEDANGEQVVVEASSIMEAAGSSGVIAIEGHGKKQRGAAGKVAHQRPPPKDVVTKRVVSTTGGPLSLANSVSTPIEMAVQKRKAPEEPEFDWNKIDPKKLKFALRYGCGFCGSKSYKDINDLKKHRRECKDRDKYACDSCLAHVLKDQEAVAADEAAKLKRRTATVHPMPQMASAVSMLSDKIGGKSVHGSPMGTLTARVARPPSAGRVGVPAVPAPEMRCRVCAKTFLTAEQLKLHLINVHLGSSAFAPQVIPTTLPPGATLISENGTILQGSHETVQIIASGSPSSSSVVGQWVA